MGVLIRFLALTALLGICVSADSRGPVVVELFTSEGCSSCPPADLLLEELTTHYGAGVEIIPLSEHVDYWNHLGWRDPFSSSQFSARQQAYSEVFGADTVYTPQMIVDGLASFNGSDGDQARKSIKMASQQPKAVVSIHKAEGKGRVTVRVDQLRAAKVDEADVFLAVTESRLTSSVARGENEGRTLRHTGVVRSLVRVVQIEAKRGGYVAELEVQAQRGWNAQNTRAVIFVQDRKTRRIVGAASCSL
jgi:hypothetical protein